MCIITKPIKYDIKCSELAILTEELKTEINFCLNFSLPELLELCLK